MSVSLAVSLGELMAARPDVRVELKSQYFSIGGGVSQQEPWLNHYAAVSFAGNPEEFFMVILSPEASPYAVANARTDDGHRLMRELVLNT